MLFKGLKTNMRASGCTLALLLSCLALSAGKAKPHLDEVRFEVVAVTVLSEREAATRSGDCIGSDVVVRLRLTAPDSYGVYFFSEMPSVVPAGYLVREKDGSIVWRWGLFDDRDQPISPGIEKLSGGFPGVWLLLPPRTSVEWEQLDATRYAEEKHAFTAYIKLQEGEPAREVVSRFYSVPRKPARKL